MDVDIHMEMNYFPNVTTVHIQLHTSICPGPKNSLLFSLCLHDSLL
jgi:hypothetical protein